jgi:hypothetical protein
MDTRGRFPVAVGGVGGSGTRTVAAFLLRLGYYLGDDLNESLDNIWFTLLFKRRSILVEDDVHFEALAEMFFSRMSGSAELSEADRARAYGLADCQRLQHPHDWLLERAKSFTSGQTSRRPDQPWGWKEPNTHIVIDRLFSLQPKLRYLHVFRHPLDMSISSNQNQLLNWGPVFLSRDVSVEPRLSLSYWCAAHRRMVDFVNAWPERAMLIDFDSFCHSPDTTCSYVTAMLEMPLQDDVMADFREFVRPPDSAGRSRSVALDQYDPADLAYLAQIGYAF